MPTYDRYQFFKQDGKNITVPFITLDKKPTDIQVVYKSAEDRMDKLSQKYYGDPTYGWLIMIANPSFGGLEFNIPNETIITIPYPLQKTVEDYFNKVKLYQQE